MSDYNPYDRLPRVASFELTSEDVRDGEELAQPQVSGIFGAGGEDISPQLAWSGFPESAGSFAVTCYDPDAPTGSGFWHWWVADLPADATGLAKGAGSGTGLPAGAVQARNDFGTIGYGGPCPPKGARHHYEITVYALDVEKLGVGKDASPAVFGSHAHAHALEKATLTGLYGR